jgi:RecB family exonuclease
MNLTSKIQHLSFSSIIDAENCLAGFWAKRLSPNPVPDIPDRARDRGTAAHSMAEHFIRLYAKGEPRDIAATAAIRLALEATGKGAVHEEAVAIFSKWRDRFNLEREDIFAVERLGAAAVEGVPIPVIGYDDVVYFDRLTNENAVRDLKTKYSATVTPDYEFQGDLSALRWEEQYAEMGPVRSEVDFMRSGTVVPRAWNDARREATVARVQAAWHKLEAADYENDWPATPGSHCGFCPVAVACAKRKLAEEAALVVLSPASAEQAVRNKILFTEAASRLANGLKTYVDANGPVTVGRASASYTIKDVDTIKDVPAAIERLSPLERARLGPVLQIKGTKAAQKLIHDPRMADLVSTTTSTRFGIKGNVADLDVGDGDEYLADDEDEAAYG